MPRGSKRSAPKSGNTIEKEVANLFALGNNANQNTLLTLRNKYGDDQLVDEIERVFVHRHADVVKKAKNFASAVRNKYAHANIPYHMILEKAKLHARKHSLSAAEFAEFQRMFEQELAGTSRQNEVVVPVTNMMRILGNLAEAGKGGDGRFTLQGGDYKALQEILKLYADSKQLHAQVVLQSLVYGDGLLDGATSTHGPISPEALVVRFDKNKHNQTDHIHPLLVALFLRANHEFDNHFLLSNIAGIVKSRYNKEALTTRADYELFYDMVTDPNDIICDHRSPMADLLHRANLQNSLWHNVISLRNGRCYDESFRNFMANVDVCRLNKYDNPDLVYGRHDGTIAKRLLSAFSYRPTVVTTRPVQTVIMANNPYSVNVRPTVTRIPMVTFRATTRSNYTDARSNAIFLRSELSQAQRQYFIEGNVVVQREVNILYSRGNVIVYIDRRGTRIDLQNYPTMHYNQVPVGVNGFERINTNIKVLMAAFDKDQTTAVTVCGGTTQIKNISQETGVRSDSICNDILVGHTTDRHDKYYLSALLCANITKINQNLSGSRTDEDVVIGSRAYVNTFGSRTRDPVMFTSVGADDDQLFAQRKLREITTGSAQEVIPTNEPNGSTYLNFIQYDPMITVGMRTVGGNQNTSPYTAAEWDLATGKVPVNNGIPVRDALCNTGLLLVLTNENLVKNLRVRSTNA
uniref:Uncharacterized protein n=1 Tax=viral metagenome TaxID=1070528 RepID=A0A6C0J8Y1_9ZZZZ